MKYKILFKSGVSVDITSDKFKDLYIGKHNFHFGDDSGIEYLDSNDVSMILKLKEEQS